MVLALMTLLVRLECPPEPSRTLVEGLRAGYAQPVGIRRRIAMAAAGERGPSIGPELHTTSDTREMHTEGDKTT